MLVTNIFSGLLAAVMVALGAGQIGNTSTQVGEELVAEKTVAIQDLHWFSVDQNGDFDSQIPTREMAFQRWNAPMRK